MHEALWQRIDAALDARLDPFDEPDLAQALRGTPEVAEQVRRLLVRLDGLAKLDGLERLAAPAAPPVSMLGWRPAAAGVAAAALCVFALRTGSLSLPTPSSRTIDSVSLVVEHMTPPPARGERVVLESRRVVGWTLEGNTP